MTSPLTNTRSGSFHKLELLNSSGDFQDLLALISAGGGLSSAQASALIAAALTSYSSTAALGVLLNTKVDMTYLVAILATYTNTPTITNLLAGKQALLTSTVDIACQDITLRYLTASQSAFTISGGLLTTVKDNANNILMTFENAGLAVARPFDCQDTSQAHRRV